MKTHKCPKCGANISRTWVNKKRGHQLVGYCPKEKKTVNLGRAENFEEARPAAEGKQSAAKPATKAAGKTGAKGGAAGAGEKRTPAPADSDKRGAGQPGPVQPAGAVSKRSGIAGFFRELFEFD